MNLHLTLSIVMAAAFVAGCAARPSAAPEPTNAPPPHHGGPGEHAHGPEAPACKVLARTCHAHDKESEQAHACHVLGHAAKSDEECEAKRAECLAVCGGDAGG